MPLVAVIRKRVHDYRCQHIGRSDQALRCRNTEAHALVQNDGQEVSNGVRAGGGESEQASKAPDLQVSRICQIFLDIESGQCQWEVRGHL